MKSCRASVARPRWQRSDWLYRCQHPYRNAKYVCQQKNNRVLLISFSPTSYAIPGKVLRFALNDREESSYALVSILNAVINVT